MTLDYFVVVFLVTNTISLLLFSRIGVCSFRLMRTSQRKIGFHLAEMMYRGFTFLSVALVVQYTFWVLLVSPMLVTDAVEISAWRIILTGIQGVISIVPALAITVWWRRIGL